MKNTDRGVAITAAADGGRQVMVSYYHYNGVTDTKDKKSVNLAPSAEGPRMTPSAVQQSPTPGGSNGFHFPEDDGSKVELSEFARAVKMSCVLRAGRGAESSLRLQSDRQPAPHEDHDLLPLRRRGQLEEQQRDHSPRAWSV